jgi:hypothetical protein
MVTPSSSTLTSAAPAGYFVSKNPILDNLERGVESDTGKFKIGNGVARWNALPYGIANAPIVTGSKVSGAALQSLLTVLATAGIITDSTVA